MTLPPGPSAPPAVQTVRWLFRPIEFLGSCRRRYGDAFSVKFIGFQTPMVMISDPESIRALYRSRENGLPPGRSVLRARAGQAVHMGRQVLNNMEIELLEWHVPAADAQILQPTNDLLRHGGTHSLRPLQTFVGNPPEGPRRHRAGALCDGHGPPSGGRAGVR
jgi:hypothetical protein